MVRGVPLMMRAVGEPEVYICLYCYCTVERRVRVNGRWPVNFRPCGSD